MISYGHKFPKAFKQKWQQFKFGVIHFNCYKTTYNIKNYPRRPRADSAGEGKSKRAEKYGTKKGKERREEPLGTMVVFTPEPKLLQVK